MDSAAQECRTERPLRLLVHGLNYAPDLIGIPKYTTEMCEWLAARGHQVRVVTAPPYYPAWAIGEGYSSWSLRRERINGVEVRRYPLWVPSNPTGLARLTHLASFAASSAPGVLARGLAWRPDVVWTVAPALIAAPFSLAAAKLAGAVSWLHLQDFEVDAAFALGLLGGGLRHRLALETERRLMRGFDRVSTISPQMLNLLHTKGVDPGRTMIMRNWIDTNRIAPLDRPSALRAELGLAPGTKVALYAGNMATKQGLPILIRAASRLAHRRDLVFVLAGAGPGRAELEAEAAGLANIRFLPMQPLERLNELLNLADIHLLPQRADAADLVLPSKLTGIMASGRPVVATAFPDTGLAREIADAGTVTPPGDAEAFAKAIEDLADSPERRAAAGEAARRHALGELDIDAILVRFEAEMYAARRTAHPDAPPYPSGR
ncbi:MAG: WcaI family glycosyltransferase [Azospirillaceae bacterium]